MFLWFAAIAAGFLAAAVPYGRTVRGRRIAPLVALRAAAGTLIVALVLDAPAGRRAVPSHWVALDASESLGRAQGGGDGCSRAARDSARAAGGPVYQFGDSVRLDARERASPDRASSVSAVVDRAVATGAPVVIVTDGEVDDAERLTGLPAGSRMVLVSCVARPDVALASLDAPASVTAGDTVRVRVSLAAAAAAAPPGRLTLALGERSIASADLPAIGAGAVTTIELRGVAGPGEGPALLRTTWSAPGDAEPRNDTLAMTVDVTHGPAAVFVSTSPDYDAREAVAAVRGVTSLPTRAFYRVAPGAWRADGLLSPVAEGVVRAAIAVAPLVILHGDTAVFGAPRAVTHGSLLLFAPPASDEGEWFLRGAPASPLAGALARLPFDSLAPLEVTPPRAMPHGQWAALVARRAGAQGESRAALVGWDEPRHVAVIGAAGFWRWRFRGGVRADAYQTLFGSLFDWLAVGRADARAASPDSRVVRAGQPVRWRRGTGPDSLVHVTLRRRGATGRVQRMTLHFEPGAIVSESPPLAVGIYDVEVPGGRSVLAVNASRELVPRARTVRAGGLGGTAPAGVSPSLRSVAWIHLVVVALLCGEWIGRRRAGLG